jgi:hypothetical protein
LPTISAEQLLTAEAREQARMDLAVELWVQDSAEQIDDLLRNTERRNPEIFEMLGADPDAVIADYEAVPVEDRDFRWIAGLSAMSVAARMQVWVSHKDELIDMWEIREQRINAPDITPEDLTRAAKVGISRRTIAEQKDALTKRAADNG